MSLTTRSRIKVPANDDNIHCLGKRDQCREVTNKIGGYLVPQDRLDKRYDSVKAPKPQGEDQNAGENGQLRGCM